MFSQLNIRVFFRNEYAPAKILYSFFDTSSNSKMYDNNYILVHLFTLINKKEDR